MADFNKIRQQLNDTRNKKTDEQQALFAGKEKLNRINREKAQLNRIYDDENQEHVSRRNQIDAQLKETKQEVDRLKTELEREKENELEILKQFSFFTDPREQIGNMNDAYPFLLLPVRIETRFKKVNIQNGITNQLWIRIYPDDCSVDSFEKLLSETEVKNAQLYWSQIWQAGGVEDQERGAWRSLVSSHGSGRGSYIITQYKPVTLEITKPIKNNNDDIILVISTEQMPTDAERNALIQYWKTLWVIFGKKDEEKNSYDDLVAVVGAANADDLITKYVPFNFDTLPLPPKTKADVDVQVVFLEFSKSDELDTKQQSWSQAPHVDVMPDRFVIIGYQDDEKAFEIVGNPIPSPLIVGPDPSAEPEEQFIKDENGDLTVGEDMRWMVDFDTAIQNGLGFKISITEIQSARGFDRIVALGIRLSADENKGQEMVETLINHHHLSRKGFSLLKQGTPTNNTETEGAGHQTTDDADESFDELKQDKLFEIESDWFLKSDGQWLAESLGINYDALYKVKNSGHTDQSEARFMNVALWPATIGYMMETLMQPVFDTNDITNTRTFFNRFVSGRGMVPAVKIGKQPYGILPTTSFSKIKWIQGKLNVGIADSLSPQISYLATLYSILRQIDDDWVPLLNNVSYIGKTGGDAHQILLDVIGLNPASVEFYQRNAESIEELFNRFNLMGFSGAILAIIIAAGYVQSGQSLLNKLGYSGTEVPDILNKFFLQSQNLLKGPLIDDRPLSEIEIIRKYTPDPNSKNYIEWLINAVQTSHDVLRKQEGFIDGKIPATLLYLMMHHALDLSYVEVSLSLFQKAALLTQEQVLTAKMEPPFVHIQQSVKSTESKWQYLYSTASEITGNNDLLVGDFIPKIIKTEVASEYLNEQLNALEQLKNVPTARLERAFTEHIDCCSYRLDAWKAGIMNYQLSSMRQNVTNEEKTHQKGIYLGAYGWLENVKSENKNLSLVELSDTELNDIFIKDQPIPLVKDDKNGGYILAPSLNHAVTAAILRNGYISNNDPDALRVNLSSERVRKVLSVLEGIRGGQSLGALLGYYLERGLHDGHPGIELDYFIHQLRKAFPLVANRNKDTKVDETSEQSIDSVEAIEARNVINGLSLIEHIKNNGSATYPFGITFLPPVDNTSQAAAINEEVQKIMNINDAVADVAIAEGVHQIVQGNYDRGAATLDTYSKGNFPPLPDVIQTPRSGINITHRVGLHFEVGLDPQVQLTPRAQAEPAINKWLSSVLPDLSEIVCSVSYGTTLDEEISVNDLNLQPIDLLYLINTDQEQAMKEIDDRVVKFILDKPGVRPDTVITVNYMKQVNDRISFFELAPLMNSLRSILLRSRPLTPNDIILANDAKAQENGVQFLDVRRAELRYTALDILLNTTLNNYKTSIETLVTDVDVNRNLILTQIDQLMTDLIAILFELSKSGLPQSGYGYIYERKREMYAAVIKKLDELIKRWDDKLIAFGDLVTDYDELPGDATDEVKFELLKKARKQLSTIADTTFPPDPDDYKNDLLLLSADFVAKQDQFKTLFFTTTNSLSTFLSDIKAELPISDFDLVPLEIIDLEDQIILFSEELAGKANSLFVDLTSRLTKARALIDESQLITGNKKEVDLILEAAKLLFHEDFKIIPEFSMPADKADEWAKSFNALNQLLDHSTSIEIDFPVDDWLYGVARVREKMKYWENLTVLTEAFEKPEIEFHPIQLPFKENDSWLALSYPEDYDIESDRLLYTAHYAIPYDKTQRQCGLLLDEWTEIVPSKKETVGVTFHYDRPNSEPPQVMLLAMPTEFKGAWQWEDLVDTLNETLEMAKKRAIEPMDIDTTSYSRFLSAVVSSMTVYPLTSSLNLAYNNNIHETLLTDL